jgi:hypothetical protein
MGRGDRRKRRWASDRQRKVKQREQRKAAERAEIRREASKK